MYSHLQKQVVLSGLKTEPFLRKLIMGAEIKPRPPEAYGKLLRELSAIGNNINQIAHIANMKKEVSMDEIMAAQRLAERALQVVRSHFL